MALPKLSPPPPPPPSQRNAPGSPTANLADVVRYLSSLSQWLQQVYLWLGQSSGTSPLSISGSAATALTSAGLTFIMNAGTPEGNQQASPGVFYQDTDTNIIYVKSDGDDTIGWDAIT